MSTFETLRALMEMGAVPDGRLLFARGRSVPPIDYEVPLLPRLSRMAPTHPDGSRAERRAAASPRVRPAPSTPASRAWLARHRAAVAMARCAAREAARSFR